MNAASCTIQLVAVLSASAVLLVRSYCSANANSRSNECLDLKESIQDASFHWPGARLQPGNKFQALGSLHHNTAHTAGWRLQIPNLDATLANLGLHLIPLQALQLEPMQTHATNAAVAPTGPWAVTAAVFMQATPTCAPFVITGIAKRGMRSSTHGLA